MDADDWNIFEADDFELAEARDPGNLGAELLAQVRPNGRIQDHYRVVLGGRQPLTMTTNFSNIFREAKYGDYKLRMQFWPRDLAIRRNATTTAWKGVYEMLAERNAIVTDKDDTTVPAEEVLRAMDAEKTLAEAASVRWGVVIGDDKRLRLDLVTLPASETTINGRPILKR